MKKDKFLKAVAFNKTYEPDVEVLKYVNEMSTFGSDVKELIVSFFRVTENPVEVLRLMRLERKIECGYLESCQLKRALDEISELKIFLGLAKREVKTVAQLKAERVAVLEGRLFSGVSSSQQYRIKKELEMLKSD